MPIVIADYQIKGNKSTLQNENYKQTLLLFFHPFLTKIFGATTSKDFLAMPRYMPRQCMGYGIISYNTSIYMHSQALDSLPYISMEDNNTNSRMNTAIELKCMNAENVFHHRIQQIMHNSKWINAKIK